MYIHTEKTILTNSFEHMHGFTNLSADGLSQVNTIHILNLCNHCHVHNIFHFRCVHHLFLFRYILQLFLFTNIHSLPVSISLPHYLALSLFISLPLSLQPRSLSLFRHVHYPAFLSICHSLSVSLSPSLAVSVCLSVCLSVSLSLSLSLSLSPATLTHFTLFCCGHHFSLSLSQSLSISLCLSLSPRQS